MMLPGNRHGRRGIDNFPHHIVNRSNIDIALGQGLSLPSGRILTDIWFHASFAAYTAQMSVMPATYGSWVVGFNVSNHMTEVAL